MTLPPTDEAWAAQEAAMASDEVAVLRAVLASPPDPGLPADFAAQVAALAGPRAAAAPSPWVETGLAAATVAMLLLAALLASGWAPGAFDALDRVLPAEALGSGWLPLVGAALALSGLLMRPSLRPSPRPVPGEIGRQPAPR